MNAGTFNKYLIEQSQRLDELMIKDYISTDPWTKFLTPKPKDDCLARAYLATLEAVRKLVEGQHFKPMSKNERASLLEEYEHYPRVRSRMNEWLQ